MILDQLRTGEKARNRRSPRLRYKKKWKGYTETGATYFFTLCVKTFVDIKVESKEYSSS